MDNVSRREVLTPGGVELTREAEGYLTYPHSWRQPPGIRRFRFCPRFCKGIS
jgi:hypothetical protein